MSRSVLGATVPIVETNIIGNKESILFPPDDDDDDSTDARPEPIATIDVHQVLDTIGYGRFQRRILVAAGLCSASDAMEILMLSFLVIQISYDDDWSLTPNQSSSLMASVFAGAFCGALVLGRLGDLWGRRPTFLLTAATVAIGGFLSAFCQNYNQLLAARGMVGVGIGGVAIPFDAFGELLPSSCRGKGLAYPSYFWTTGTVLVVVGAKFTTSWRWLCLWCAAPCAMATVVGYMVVPESPQWLLETNQVERARNILRQAILQNGMNPDDVLPWNANLISNHATLNDLEAENQNDVTDEEKTSLEVGGSIWNLMAPHRLRSSLAILVVWFGYALMYYGTVLAITNVFQHDGDIDYQAIFFATTAEVVATTMVVCTIDHFGRKSLHALSFGLGGLCVATLCWMESSSADRKWSIAVAFAGRLCIFAGSAVTWIWTAEVLETRLRTTGLSFANAGGRIGGFLAPFLVSPTKISYSTMGTILWLVSWTLAIVAWWNIPETVGKPMGEVSRGPTAGMRNDARDSEIRTDKAFLELAASSQPNSGKNHVQYQTLNSSVSVV